MLIVNKTRDVLRRHIYERPNRRFQAQLGGRPAEADCLNRDGVVILQSYFSGRTLLDLQVRFNAVASGLQPDANGEIIFGEKFLDPTFWSALTDSFIISILRHYWGRPVAITGFRGKRLLPRPAHDYDAFQYHHDGEHKRTRVMILLTDVLEGDQRMDYVPRTHRMRWNWTRPEEINFTDEEARSFGEAIGCYGPAGSVIIFDANGLHRGNRTMGRMRDGLNTRYVADHWMRWTTGPFPPKKVIRGPASN